jgi:hypothetical protein
LPEVISNGVVMGFVDGSFKLDWFLMQIYIVSLNVEPRINSRGLLVASWDSWME